MPTLLRRSALFVVEPHSRSISPEVDERRSGSRASPAGSRRGRPCRVRRRSPRRRSRTGRANSRSACPVRVEKRERRRILAIADANDPVSLIFFSVPVYLIANCAVACCAMAGTFADNATAAASNARPIPCRRVPGHAAAGTQAGALLSGALTLAPIFPCHRSRGTPYMAMSSGGRYMSAPPRSMQIQLVQPGRRRVGLGGPSIPQRKRMLLA